MKKRPDPAWHCAAGAAPYRAKEDRDSNYIGRRLQAARRELHLSLEQLRLRLAACGVEVGCTAISKWETGRVVPGAYQLMALCHALELEDDGFACFTSSCQPALNAEGRRKLREYREDLIASGRYQPQQPAAPIRYRDMPVSDLPVSAGTGTFLDEGSFQLVSFPESSIPTGAVFGIRVSGDSMEPVYHSGQIVWVQPCQTLRSGEAGVMVYDGQGYLKVYTEQEPDEQARDALQSDGVRRMQPVMLSYNQAYPPKAIRPELEFQIIGRVL